MQQLAGAFALVLTPMSYEDGVCWSCVVGFHGECYFPTDIEDRPDLIRCCCNGERKDVDTEKSKNPVGRPPSDPADMKDPVSAGRHRAKEMYEIFTGMTCEWAGLKHAGGGVFPIVGCAGNKIVETRKLSDEHRALGYERGDRHHGPDKNTLNNSPFNVHRVCSPCHNYWHALNNDTYEGTRPPGDQQWLPVGDVKQHDPSTLATDEEIEEARLARKRVKLDLAED